MQAIDETRAEMAARVTLQQLQEFSERWLEAGGHTVQLWVHWEREAAKLFGITLRDARPETMHQIMQLVIGIQEFTMPQIKGLLRLVTPSAIELAARLLSHIPEFSAVIDAELRFRMRELEEDWTFEPDGEGHIAVRTKYKRRGQVEH
jgi:hypothetical protein